MKLLFFGGAGSGKSTVGKRLANDLGWQWVSSGAILRESKEPWVVEKLKTAQLFNDEMIASLVFSRLEGVQNAIIDGFPRTLRQAQMVVKKDLDIAGMVELAIPIEEAVERLLKRGREQDQRGIIEERWRIYEEQKAEIMAFLMGNGIKMISIDGVGTEDEVYVRTVLQIQKMLKK